VFNAIYGSLRGHDAFYGILTVTEATSPSTRTSSRLRG